MPHPDVPDRLAGQTPRLGATAGGIGFGLLYPRLVGCVNTRRLTPGCGSARSADAAQCVHSAALCGSFGKRGRRGRLLSCVRSDLRLRHCRGSPTAAEPCSLSRRLLTGLALPDNVGRRHLQTLREPKRVPSEIRRSLYYQANVSQVDSCSRPGHAGPAAPRAATIGPTRSARFPTVQPCT